MKTVQIQELKKNLSAWLDRASEGERVVITRHNRPFASLGPAPAGHVHVGSRAGRYHFEPLAGVELTTSLADVLAYDRSDDR